MKGLKKALIISVILSLISTIIYSIMVYILINASGSSKTFLSFEGVLVLIGGFFLSTFLWFIIIVAIMWVKEEWK